MTPTDRPADSAPTTATLPGPVEALGLEVATAVGGTDGASEAFVAPARCGGRVLRVTERTTADGLDGLRLPVAALVVITVPTEPGFGADDLLTARAAFDARRAELDEPTTAITLQGAHVLWSRDLVAVFAPADRLERAARAAAEVALHEGELRRLEDAVDAIWEPLERNAPLAFEFEERSIHQREELSTHFVELVGLRARLARLAPHVHVPPVQPPTLASQIAERVRERTRMHERLELLTERLEAQERVYEMCASRVSEYMVARKGHILEWIIIVLLGAQTLLWIVDAFSTASVQ